jgi:hypothetical protein
VVEARGWQYEVWSEPPEVELENIRFLAGYRRDWLFSLELLKEIQGADVDGMALGRAARCLAGHPEHQVRSAIYHLIWVHRFVVALDRPLGSSQVLRRAT